MRSNGPIIKSFYNLSDGNTWLTYLLDKEIPLLHLLVQNIFQLRQCYDFYNSREPFDLFTVILNDGSEGWEPDGNVTTFVINEPEVDPDYSTVIVNTIQDNLVICAVDYLWSGEFEVHCDMPPADGAQLRYTVINMDPIEVNYPTAEKLAERYENLTEGVVVGELPSLIDSLEHINRTDTISMPPN